MSDTFPIQRPGAKNSQSWVFFQRAARWLPSTKSCQIYIMVRTYIILCTICIHSRKASRHVQTYNFRQRVPIIIIISDCYGRAFTNRVLPLDKFFSYSGFIFFFSSQCFFPTLIVRNFTVPRTDERLQPLSFFIYLSHVMHVFETRTLTAKIHLYWKQAP